MKNRGISGKNTPLTQDTITPYNRSNGVIVQQQPMHRLCFGAWAVLLFCFCFICFAGFVHVRLHVGDARLRASGSLRSAVSLRDDLKGVAHPAGYSVSAKNRLSWHCSTSAYGRQGDGLHKSLFRMGLRPKPIAVRIRAFVQSIEIKDFNP